MFADSRNRPRLAVARNCGMGSSSLNADVGIVVVGERLTKLQRDAFSHNANSIHGVDESVGARVENIAGDVLDHNVTWPDRMREDQKIKSLQGLLNGYMASGRRPDGQEPTQSPTQIRSLDTQIPLVVRSKSLIFMVRPE